MYTLKNNIRLFQYTYIFDHRRDIHEPLKGRTPPANDIFGP